MTPPDEALVAGAGLLDRLTGEPFQVGTDPFARARAVRALRDSVRRDLENLLNTRFRCLSWPPALKHLERSLVNYGIPDFTGAAFNDPGNQREFRRVIERVISQFEPRLKRVRVTMGDGAYARSRIMHFRIDAELMVDGRSVEPVAFETAMDPTNASFSVGASAR
jgi:type VI secretion system protein ImpF